MVYTLSTCEDFYQKNQLYKYEKIGFSFIKKGDNEYLIQGNPTITLNTLEDLKSLNKEFGELIIDKTSITIYNGINE